MSFFLSPQMNLFHKKASSTQQKPPTRDTVGDAETQKDLPTCQSACPHSEVSGATKDPSLLQRRQFSQEMAVSMLEYHSQKGSKMQYQSIPGER
jgi:hypothetical protein